MRFIVPLILLKAAIEEGYCRADDPAFIPEPKHLPSPLEGQEKKFHPALSPNPKTHPVRWTGRK